MHESSAIFPIITSTEALIDYSRSLSQLTRYMSQYSGDNKMTLRVLFDIVDTRRGRFITAGLRTYIRDNMGSNSNFWMLREYQRFCDFADTPNYQHIHLETAPRLYSSEVGLNHFLHLSIQNPGYVSYTASPELGREDRQVRTTFGRYIRKFYEGLTDHRIRDITNEFKSKYADLELHWARTGDEIERVYVNGPRSCMSYATDYAGFGCHVHPSRAYAAPDLAVAYLQNKENGNISARCLTYKKTFIRGYGDGTLMVMLKGLGYVQGDLGGARLARIPAKHPGNMSKLPNTYVAPYMDDPSGNNYQYLRLDNDDKYLLVTTYNRGDSLEGCGNTNGLVGQENGLTRSNIHDYRNTDGDEDNEDNNEDDRCCHRCEDWAHMEDMRHSDYLDIWLCDNCAEQDYSEAYVGPNETSLVRNEDAVEIVFNNGGASRYVADYVCRDMRMSGNIPDGLVRIDQPELLYTNYQNATEIQDGSQAGRYIFNSDVVTLQDGRKVYNEDCIAVPYRRGTIHLLKSETPEWALHLTVDKTLGRVAYRQLERTEKQFVDTWSLIVNQDLIAFPQLLTSLRTGDIGDYDFIQRNISKFYGRIIEAQKQKTSSEEAQAGATGPSIITSKTAAYAYQVAETS